MQVGGLPAGVYRLAALASRIAAQPGPSEVTLRQDALRRWRQAREQGLTAGQAARAVGVGRATLYRWAERLEPGSRRPHRLRPPGTTPDLRLAVERLRLDHPMWGRAKLGPLLRAQGFATSDATVGRILARLVARGVALPVPALIRERRLNRARPRRPHARRLPKGYRVHRPGDLVQLDTLSIALAPGRSIKQFTAYDPVAKWTVAAPFDRATARTASIFLDRLLAELPFPVRAIQVDGGAEFMAGFETACARRDIALFVLPPRSPELNGAVERCNGSWRYEFYACHDLPTTIRELTRHVQAFQHLYNHHRPHGALAGQTPARYLEQRRAQETPTSHMC
jgi:transposase InsO family protein